MYEFCLEIEKNLKNEISSMITQPSMITHWTRYKLQKIENQ